MVFGHGMTNTVTISLHFIAEVQVSYSPSALRRATFPSPLFLPPQPPLSAQEPFLSFPSPASLDALVGHFFDGPNTVRALPPSHIYPLPS